VFLDRPGQTGSRLPALLQKQLAFALHCTERRAGTTDLRVDLTPPRTVRGTSRGAKRSKTAMSPRTLALTVLCAATHEATASPLATDHLRSQLVAESTAAVPGQSLRIGLMLDHDPHWHTYWRNPGDSGLPTRIALELPAGVSASDIEWPAPYRFDVENIVNFGYGDRVLLPITLSIPGDFAQTELAIRAQASWLICEVECIPGKGDYRLQLPIAKTSDPDPRWAEDFAAAARRQPSALSANASWQRVGDQIQVALLSDALPSDIAAWSVFPATAQVVVNGAYPMWARIEGGLRMQLPASEFYANPPPRFSLLLVKDDQALAVDAALTFLHRGETPTQESQPRRAP